MMRSKRPVKLLKELIRPFTIKPDRDIYGSVNGRPFFFPRGVESECSFEAYGAVFYSEFKGEL